MKRFLKRYNRQVEWALGAFVVVSTVAAWLANTGIQNGVTLYDIFPPLGILAFGLMWTHYVMGTIRRYAGLVPDKDRTYMALSMGLVLGLIIMHPMLLFIALYNDGLGLPPASYMQVYERELVFVGLGVFGLMIFLAYEFKRVFGQKKWWTIVDWAQIVGMGAIFVHGLGLGSDVRSGYAFVWWFYGITLLAAVAYSTYMDRKKSIA